ncbi:MinD/ParA family protein [Thermodesulfobacteriota bacterium]
MKKNVKEQPSSAAGHYEPVKICITSGKGGVGKTSFVVNLAFALARSNYRVLIVDGDLGLANVDVMLKLSVQTTLRHVLESGADPMETIVFLKDNVGVLPASSGVPEMVNLGMDETSRLGTLLNSLSSQFDYVLLDTAAGIGPSVLWFNTFVDHNIVLLSPDPTSMTDSYALIKTLSRDYNRNHFFLILNFIKSELEGRQTFETLDKATKKFLNLDLYYLGSIPEDKVVKNAVRQQKPFIETVPQSRASEAVFKLAKKIQKFDKKVH